LQYLPGAAEENARVAIEEVARVETCTEEPEIAAAAVAVDTRHMQGCVRKARIAIREVLNMTKDIKSPDNCEISQNVKRKKEEEEEEEEEEGGGGEEKKEARTCTEQYYARSVESSRVRSQGQFSSCATIKQPKPTPGKKAETHTHTHTN
jgi:hypothetical protein